MRTGYACYLLKSEIANLPKKMKESLLTKNQTVFIICLYFFALIILDLSVFAKPVFSVLLRRTNVFDEFYLCFCC